MRRSRTYMRVRPALVSLAALALALLPAAQARPAEAAATCTHTGNVVTCTYGFTGAAETWVVPPGVTEAAFQVVGAPGGRSGGQSFGHADGGRGADLKATLTLVPGTPVIVTVGGPGGTDGDEAGGFNGGGGGQYVGNNYDLAGGGGGASDVRIGGAGLADRVLVAGGGGGGGSYGAGTGPSGMGGPAGGVGGDAGMAGAAGSTSAATGSATGGGGGGAGSAAAGGQGGTAGQGFDGVAGGSGGLGQGGSVASSLGIGGVGGGGGGGVYGGGGGGGAGEDFGANEAPGGGGGGGGASGTTSGFGIANVSLAVDTARVPKVVITYMDTTAPSVTVNQAAGQADPTGSNPVLFTAVFDEAVTGFSASGVILGGTADLSGATVTVSGGPNSYTISVGGLAGNGTVTAAVVANTAMDFAGNGNAASTSTDNSVTFVSDSTPPVITPNVVGTLGNNGWYVGDVSVSWTVSDPESAVTSQTGCDPQSVTTDTVSTTFTCSATSAGGSDSQPVTIKRDATKPIVVSGTPDRAPDAAGWYNAPVTVSFAGSDATSGIAACTSPTYSGPDGANTSVSGTCTDNAGNTSSPVSFSLKYDATAPTISAAATTGPNGAGWYNSDVTVAFTCADDLAGVVSCPADEVLSSEGTAVASTAQTIVDNAGNSSAPSNVVTVQIDKSAPVFGTCPAADPFLLNSGSQPVGPIGVDAAIAGLDAPASTLTGSVDTSSAGSKSVTFTATDNAGNVATQDCTYLVNTPPTIAVTTNGSACLSDSRAAGVLGLVLGDADSGANGLALTLVSNSNPALVPNANVQLGGSGADRTLTVTAAAGQSGSALLTLRVSDGFASSDLTVSVLVGTDGAETLNGTANTDMIFGLLGANTINGLGGSDLLCGGSDVDSISGDEGDDMLYGGRGNDRMAGGPGADFFSGGPGTDTATDFTASQEDSQDGTVENTTPGATGETGDPTEPKITSRLFLPAVQN